MLICAILILSGLFARPIVADDGWQDLNAWEIDSPFLNKCPICDIPNASNENGITAVFYKQIVAQLFNRNTLKKNPITGNLERTVIFSLTDAQLKIIENSSDIKDFNATVMSILKNAREPQEKHAVPENNESLLWGLLEATGNYLYLIVKNTGELFSNVFLHSNSEIRFALLVCAVGLAMWLIHKRYNKNLVLVLIVFCLVFGYFYTYIECNRKLEAGEVIEFIEENEPDTSNFLTRYFKPSKKTQQIKKIKKAAKVKLSFCRPDTVAIMYANDIFFTQLKLVVEKIVESMNIIGNELPFPFNYMGIIGLPFLFMSLLPYIFQHFFNPLVWFNIFRSTGSKDHQTKQTIDNNVHQGDRLSGENLKILLDALKNKTEVEFEFEKPKNSAVEDVKDLPEAITGKLDDSFSDPENKPITQNNNVLDEEKPKKES